MLRDSGPQRRRSAPAGPLGSQRSHPHRPPLAYEHTYIDILIGWSHPVAQTLTSWCLAAQKTTDLVLRALAAHHHRRPTTTAQCTDTPPRPPRPPPAVRTCSRVYGRRLKRAARVARGDLTRLHENVLNRQSADLNPTDGLDVHTSSTHHRAHGWWLPQYQLKSRVFV